MYALTWLGKPLDRLADAYTDAPVEVRERMAGAIALLNGRLKNAPLDEGESRSGNVRVTFVAGLTILFEVVESARTVTVVRLSRRGP